MTKDFSPAWTTQEVMTSSTKNDVVSAVVLLFGAALLAMTFVGFFA